MKKFISFLLSFIVLLTCFVVPSAAASEDVSNLVVVRGFMSRDTAWLPYGDWFECSRTPFHANDLNNQLTEYHIGENNSDNPKGDYISFITLYNSDSSSLSTNKQDLRIELNGLFDQFIMSNDPNDYNCYFNFNGSMASKISVTIKDLQGNSYSVDNFTVNTKVNSNGTWKLSLDIPSQDKDVYHAYIRFYFNIFDVTNNLYTSPHMCLYGFGSDSSALIDLEPRDNTGLLQTILEWLEGIWEGITGLPDLIRDKLSVLFDAIGNAIDNMKNAVTGAIEKIKTWLTDLGNSILDGLKELFIPDDNYFSDRFTALYENIKNRLGVLSLPFVLIKNIFDMYDTIGNGDGIINYPEFSIFGTVVIDAGSVNFKEWVYRYTSVLQTKINFNWIQIYYAVMDVIIWLGFIWFCQKKYKGMIK